MRMNLCKSASADAGTNGSIIPPRAAFIFLGERMNAARSAPVR